MISLAAQYIKLIGWEQHFYEETKLGKAEKLPTIYTEEKKLK
jgi:hypothetical protein